MVMVKTRNEAGGKGVDDGEGQVGQSMIRR